MKLEELAKKLIQFKTTTGNFKEVKNCFDFIKKYAKDNLLYFKEYEFNGYKSLLISNGKDFNYDILFNGHIDVVSASENLFTPKIENGYLIGRGAIDMKGADAVMLSVLANYKGNKKIGLLLTSDEEIGGFNGVEKFVETEKFKAKLVVVPDGGSNFDITIAEKGILQLNLTVKGKSAHSSMLNEGENAILKSYSLFNKIVSKFCKNINPPIDDNLSINLAFLRSGDAYNKVPSVADVGIDIRYFKLNSQEIIDYIKEISPDTGIKINTKANPFFVNEDDENFKTFLKIVENEFGKINKVKTNGASDARFFSNFGLSVAIMNPIGYNFHGDNEKVNIKSLYKLKEIYFKLINNI